MAVCLAPTTRQSMPIRWRTTVWKRYCTATQTRVHSKIDMRTRRWYELIRYLVGYTTVDEAVVAADDVDFT